MTISRRQFGVFVRHDHNWSGSATSEYVVGEHDKDDPRFFDAYGRVHVSHRPAVKPVGDYTYDDDPYFPQPKVGQQRLFADWSTPGRPAESKVSLMEFSKRTRALALPLLGRAALDAREINGVEQIIPDTDRSEHSERLVQRLAARGAIEPSERENYNSMDFLDSPVPVLSEGLGPMPKADLDAGRQHARSVLRATRTKKQPETEQLHFPGMRHPHSLAHLGFKPDR